MKKFIRKLAIIGIILSVFSPAAWSGEFNYASYAQTTLQDIITEEQNQSSRQAEAKGNSNVIQLDCSVPKYLVECRYSNTRRPISDSKKNLIILWMEMLRIDSALTSIYQQEILVTEGAKEYWMPIQEKLNPYMNQELAENDTIDLFIILIGKIETEFVFIVTEFDMAISPAENSLSETANMR